MQPEPVVEISSGKVRGTRTDQVTAFLGIPYAKAARFEAPEAPDPWAGVRDADAFGPLAPQSDTNATPGRYGIVLELLGGPKPPVVPESEDCQTLNVWTSDPAPARPKPVMLWLHPGFFMLGSGASGNGATLAARGDVVVVSLNHRLNVFGFCHLDDIAPGFRHSGNAGMLDIVAALGWVRDNIARFGGDPDRVMVFGASGGGMKTAWLTASPTARGLVHRAGAQSGPGLRFMDREDASAISEQLLSEFNLRPAQADDLRRVPMDALLAAYHRIRVRNKPSRFTHLPFFAPVRDAEVNPRHPYDPDAAPQAASIPMILGWNRQDMAFFPGADLSPFDLDAEGAEGRLSGIIGDRAGSLLAAYRGEDAAALASDLYHRVLSDWSVGGAILTQADRRVAAGGAATFVYRYDLPSPALDGKLGAVHSSETPLLFGTPGPLTPSDPDALALGAAMRDAWVNFAATGDVNAGAHGLPDWPEYGASGRVMLLNRASRAVADPIPDHAQWAAP